MSKRRRLFVAVLAIAALFVSAVMPVVSAASSTNEWLYGTWQLAFDPDDSPTDWVRFQPGDKVTLILHNTQEVSGSCKVLEKSILLLLDSPRGIIELSLTISEDKNRLFTSSGAYYTKIRQ